jgi:DNA (cytosine-5)-methyltransferase 1
MAEYAIGSLCSGYGGLDMAVQSVLGGTVAWHCQYDPDDRNQYAARVLEARFPSVPNHGDITSIDWTRVEPVDILTAGFPCQPVSNAGKRKGQDDDRWLWPDVADAVRALRPRLVLLENVSALLVRGFGAVADSLAALGYGFAWTCLRASDVGAAHRRERWFCLAWDADDDLRLRPWGPVEPAEPDQAGDAGGATADSEGVGEREPADQANPLAGGGDAREEPRRRSVRATAHPARLGHGHARTQGLGGAPSAAVASAAANAEGVRRGEGRPEPAGFLRRPDAPERGRAAPADADDSGALPQLHREPHRPEAHDEHEVVDAPGRVLDWGPYAPAIARWERVMGRPAPAATEPGKNGPRLAPVFVEWLMGLPAGHVTDTGIPRNAQLKCLGNGVVPQQGTAALRQLMTHLTVEEKASAA